MDSRISHQVRRLEVLLFLANAAFTTGTIATATVNPIIGAKLGGSAALAGIPSAVYLAGSALGAFSWGQINSRIGRVPGLILGTSLGVLGALVSGLSIVREAFLPYLVGMFFIGAALAAIQLSRFIAADVNPPERRGRAIANVILGGAAGSIAGPLVLGPANRLIAGAGFDELAGPFLAAFLVMLLAAGLAVAALKPSPESLSSEISLRYPGVVPNSGLPGRSLGQIFRQPPAALALTTMFLSMIVMVSLMVITSLFMKDHQHNLNDISLVISSHTFGMFAFSLISGRLVDRLGRVPVILIGAFALTASGVMASISKEVLPLAVTLFLLGMGWNFSFIGGSSLLADQLAPSERVSTQGFNDLLMNGGAALASLSTGLIYSAYGYADIALLAAGASAILFLIMLVFRLSQFQARPAAE
jgi:MFS family permease